MPQWYRVVKLRDGPPNAVLNCPANGEKACAGGPVHIGQSVDLEVRVGS